MPVGLCRAHPRRKVFLTVYSWAKGKCSYFVTIQIPDEAPDTIASAVQGQEEVTSRAYIGFFVDSCAVSVLPQGLHRGLVLLSDTAV